MRRPLNSKNARANALSVPKTVQSPVGGLNSRDPLAKMRPEDALILENFICRPVLVELRAGQASYGSIPVANAQVESLLPYRNGASGKLFAGTSFGIYNTSVAGVATLEIACTDGKWISVNSANAGIRYLVMVNGVDLPLFYNGTIWQTSVITGISDSKLLNTIHQHSFRLFFTEEGTLSFWYLPVNSVQGVVAEFPLGALFTKGGALQAIGSWTVDNGTGSDDLAVFITSEGELAVYRGTDPSNAATWAMVGVYELPKPIGKNCFYRLGGELLVITESGLVSVSKLLQSVAIDRTSSLSDKTRGEISTLATAFKGVFGWELLRYSPEDVLILNIPNSTQTGTVQMVMNTLTGAWSKFTGMPANCFAEFNGNLYYGGNAVVVQALTGQSDFGNNIVGKVKTAFNYFGYGIRQKHVKLLRPNFHVSKKLSVSFALSTNFQVYDVISQSSTTPNGVSLWDVSTWDQSYWVGDSFTDDQWRTVAQKPGYCIALLLQINDKDVSFQWFATDYLLGLGNLLG